MRSSRLLVAGILFLASTSALAQTPSFSEVLGVAGRLLRRSGTISIVQCLEIREARSAPRKSMRSPHSSSRRMASFVRATSWTPRRYRKFKCPIATDSFPSVLKIFRTNASGAAARVSALREKISITHSTGVFAVLFGFRSQVRERFTECLIVRIVWQRQETLCNAFDTGEIVL